MYRELNVATRQLIILEKLLIHSSTKAIRSGSDSWYAKCAQKLPWIYKLVEGTERSVVSCTPSSNDKLLLLLPNSKFGFRSQKVTFGAMLLV